jgi:catalase
VGFFGVMADVSSCMKAAYPNRVGKRTPVFIRFSTVTTEPGSADTADRRCGTDPH